jgi:hypothetical protein
VESARASQNIRIFAVLTVILLVVIFELIAYVTAHKLVPSRMRMRAGCGTVDYQMSLRKKQHESSVRPASASARPWLADHDDSDPQMFHPILGWDYPANVAYTDKDGVPYRHGRSGERMLCTDFPTASIATYGDSFTYCAEVRDHETWQTCLGGILGTNVLNYGVAGYGTDQAVLKYEKSGDSGARVVMLGILPENINRVVNIYRPFYTYDESISLTKPRFIKSDGRVKLIPNPIHSVADLRKLDDPAFLEQLGWYDYWFQMDKHLPRLGFPYLVNLWGWSEPIAKQVSLASARTFAWPSKPTQPLNLYDDGDALAIMCHLADRFVATARDRGQIPVILIMSHTDYVREVREFDRARAEPLVRYLRGQRYALVDLVEEMAGMNPSSEIMARWYKGHATAEGNRVTAEIIHRRLGEMGIIPKPVVQSALQ